MFLSSLEHTFSYHRTIIDPYGQTETADRPVHPPAPFLLILGHHKSHGLMMAQGEGRSPMRSSDAETDFKPIIIIIIVFNLLLKHFDKQFV